MRPPYSQWMSSCRPCLPLWHAKARPCRPYHTCLSSTAAGLGWILKIILMWLRLSLDYPDAEYVGFVWRDWQTDRQRCFICIDNTGMPDTYMKYLKSQKKTELKIYKKCISTQRLYIHKCNKCFKILITSVTYLRVSLQYTVYSQHRKHIVVGRGRM